MRQPCVFGPFRRLREGKLFVVETESVTPETPALSPTRRVQPLRRVEHFWLCDECARFFTLTFDRERGMITLPLSPERFKSVSHMPSPRSGSENTESEPGLTMAACGQMRGV